MSHQQRQQGNARNLLQAAFPLASSINRAAGFNRGAGLGGNSSKTLPNEVGMKTNRYIVEDGAELPPLGSYTQEFINERPQATENTS
ncbi:MAG: hypothetical protein ACR2N1_15810 [Rubripirellula sp.]